MKRLVPVVVLAVVLLPAAPARAAGSAPALPTVNGDKCVPASPRTVDVLPWAQQWMTPERAWPLTTGKGVTVAIVDTGVSTGNPALRGAVRGATTDCAGHGTFLAGLVAARRRPHIGFAGVAPDASILAVTVETSTQSSTSTRYSPSAKLAAGIRSATSGGAKVILVGAVSRTPSAELLAAVKAAQAADALVVAGVAETTEGGRSQSIPTFFPAAYPGVLGVAAIGPNGAPTPFTLPSEAVDLAAPGMAILGAAPHGTGHYAAQGTSFAAAFVAGTAALVRAYYPNLTAEEVTGRLRLTALPPSTGTPDPWLGYGVVDPVAAVSTKLPDGAGELDDPTLVVPAAVTRPPEVDRSAQKLALLVAAAGVAAGVLGWLTAAVVRRGRTRRWRIPA